MVSIYWNGGGERVWKGEVSFYERFFAYILYGEGGLRKHAEQ